MSECNFHGGLSDSQSISSQPHKMYYLKWALCSHLKCKVNKQSALKWVSWLTAVGICPKTHEKIWTIFETLSLQLVFPKFTRYLKVRTRPIIFNFFLFLCLGVMYSPSVRNTLEYCFRLKMPFSLARWQSVNFLPSFSLYRLISANFPSLKFVFVCAATW